MKKLAIIMILMAALFIGGNGLADEEPLQARYISEFSLELDKKGNEQYYRTSYIIHPDGKKTQVSKFPVFTEGEVKSKIEAEPVKKVSIRVVTIQKFALLLTGIALGSVLTGLIMDHRHKYSN